ncbi:transglutaminase domain-containing protein [Caldalkalibacillus thermarum TA2.A1]|uniref:DUF3488 and transglutaminase-like domain-containing protein n=1 Tax=Caldalkalibacillus thermarum (strain TA2.A1) TaxID=986075 RepID=F5L6Q3_CALTT|nr:transglutaminase domain-containing protein [Caldalkalibacillus thermarum]EGL83004.1 transglutaminase domain-containing protein [Caldalkalibacillus thermarum TA2.A1]QZT34599.1 DUF3488 and transglutaminase-like domain-containing protein [Caldalkalibacillus thermarum TA2.A1]
MLPLPKHQARPLYPFPAMAMIILLTLLFWEWLRPLPLLTATHAVYPFVLFFAAVLGLKVLSVKWYISLPLLSFMVLFFIHQLYFTVPLFSVSWLAYLVQDVLGAVLFILQREWVSVSFLSRTLFFFGLIWLIALSLYQSVLLRQRALYFVVMTITYLAVMDTFTPFEAQAAVIRAVISGFLLLSLLQWCRIARQTEPQQRLESVPRPLSWLAMSLIFIVAAAGMAYTAPKAEPAWPDPVAFIQGYGEGSGMKEKGVQRVGYGGSDKVLGGPFIQDDTVVFHALTDTLHYWRGESRDYYNGRGWENTDSLEIFFPFEEVGQIKTEMGFSLTESGTETEIIRAELYYEGERSQLFYPGDPLELRVFADTDVVLGWDIFSGRWYSYARSGRHQPAPLAGYELVSEYPSYSVKALKETNKEQVPPEIRNRYTQLPDSLPDRVRELAQEAAAGAATMYDQVRAIESYFRRNGYEYETEDVPVPGPDEDYVDQFLFETQRGYCDNFSSAMVVMLRTLDIPARWVKGFTSGEVVERTDGKLTTVVRNKNAHSWVEVYFPGTGWVPFEPTRTFQNPYQFVQDDVELSQEQEMAAVEEDFLEQQLAERLEHEDSEPAAALTDEQSSAAGFKTAGWMAAAGLVCVLLLSLTVLLFWRKVILSWVIWRYRQGMDREWLLNTYALLIRYLGRFIKPKHPSQTLREYILSLETHLDPDNINPLIRSFEETRYGNRQPSVSRMRQVYRLWRAVMKQLKS